MKTGISLVSVVFSAALISRAIPAQVPVDDGFGGGPCCSPASGSLPAFPITSVTGLGACIADCGLESQFPISTALAPAQVLSDYALISITIDAQPAFSIVNQVLAAKYARTWIEVAPGGVQLQVWRFLVNGDLAYAPGPAGAPGNPIPLSALPPHGLPVHFIGNVDYAKNLGTGAWEVAYTLSHFCPVESHAAFSQRPIPEASQWTNRTYHFVGPSNFTFDAFPSVNGPIVGESSRRSTGLASAGPYTSYNEAGLHRGLVISTSNPDCVGGNGAPASTTPRYSHQMLAVTSEFCGAQSSLVSAVPVGIPTIPTGLRGLGIGKYLPASGSHYPGEEYVSVYLGVLDAAGVCPTLPSASLHAVSGVGTAGGNAVILFEVPLPLTSFGALDLHDMNVFTPAGFVPGFGSLFGSEYVWSFATI